ncbi:LPS export ABC transporter permease LptF [Candidatus Aminicenantes bacterium AC-335-A11]|nr:LPS export ABC transporter permease LptF [SCandidatus Aminicenantes bacterium Aminicenantia_JdfR_composite]MCP2596417.1 LPS export ABC transporter permease LptF [Candidatus Aminicenantes bacterium AC-335-G13]MCP2606188.1 LPS export ABC transporter permease LptF [Candidatus Aminicenantes bacterium AC-708-I09]MCP2618205.1 LPS export ABC transporter permease LptF [Candidatus Aminicenantes bacterium AC-335-A11]MCP2620996.1 LPS export ABC transporter permease LptF [Candidatus Aminicenantes bacter
MLKLVDRYILKEITSPFLIGLLVYTFVMLMNEILISAELFITQNVPFKTVINLLIYLVPSILAFTLPMAVLMGILAGFSRMSSDYEIMALRSSGVSLVRLLRPVIIFSSIWFLVTLYLTLWMSPHYNHKFIKTFNQVVISKTKFQIKPREFYESIPNMVIFIQDKFPTGEWKNIFVNLSNSPGTHRIILARKGNLEINKEEQKAILNLQDGLIHSYSIKDPEKYSLTAFSNFREELDIKNLFVKVSREKRVREKDIEELFSSIRKMDKTNSLYNSHLIEIHKKFALPFACVIFAFLGLPLGISVKKGGRTIGFTISLFFILIYYIIITGGENLARDNKISPFLGMWGANIIIGVFGFILFYSSLKELTFPPKFFSKIRIFKNFALTSRNIKNKKFINLKFPRLFDRYIITRYIKIASLVFFSILSIFIIITFFERIDNVYEHKKSIFLLFQYIWYFIPKIVYLILPVTALTSVLLTFGLLTKSNEIVAFKACGLSIYRLILPVIIIALIFSGLSFIIQEKILPYSNRKAEEIWDKINDVPPRSYRYLDRRWVFGKTNRIYNYTYFDPEDKIFSKVSIFELDIKSWSLKRRIFAQRGVIKGNLLILRDAWLREFNREQSLKFVESPNLKLLTEETGDYFIKEWKVPDQMNFFELKKYIKELEDSGFETVKFKVDLNYKISFPLVSLIITILAFPFSFLMGKRGALYGIGLSIALTLIYWSMIGVFKSLGYIEFLPPFLSAWVPNFIFLFLGIYLLFNIKT